MKRCRLVLLTVIMTLVLSGCGGISYPNLPDNAIVFEIGEFVDSIHDNAKYGTIEYEGRTYIGYGTLAKSLTEKDIDRCVGYIIQDGESSSTTNLCDKSIRVYTLAGDAEHNYLMNYDTATSLMNQPSFLRAIDTQGTNIPTPDYIECLEYSYWK